MTYGSALATTTSLSLRTSASSAASVIRVMPLNALVTMSNATPSNGFYVAVARTAA